MINLTPHPITIVLKDGSEITYEPSGTVARVSTTETELPDLDHGWSAPVPVIRRETGEVTGLPAEGHHCIVSSMVLAAIPGRPNTYAPDTGPTAIRDDQGRIQAVTRLVAA